MELLFSLQGCKDEPSDKVACWLPVSAVGKAEKPDPRAVMPDGHFQDSNLLGCKIALQRIFLVMGTFFRLV